VVKPKTIVIALLAVLIAILAARRLFPSEAREVRKQFDRLSKWVSKGRAESALTMARKIKRIGTLFADPCKFRTPIYSFSGTYTPEEISSYAAAAHLQLAKLSLRFYDHNIQFPEEGTAKVVFTAKLTGTTKMGESIHETHEVECTLRKSEDKWLFTDCEVVEVLKK